MEKFDAIVIGAGQAGVPLAKKLAQSGLKTALIERRLVGGTCINDGCTPTKAMVASARMAHLANTAEELGIAINDFKVDFSSIMDRKNKIVTSFREGSVKGIEKTENLHLIYGEARFESNTEVTVHTFENKDIRISAEKIFINTGSTARVQPIEGINSIDYLTSTTLLEIEELPEHLLIVGGGYIGLEFGQMFGRFGSRVTILEKGDRLMPHEDVDVCGVVSDFFSEEGIEVQTNAEVVKFEKSEGGKSNVTVRIGDENKVYECTHVLMASGRKPNSDDLGLEHTDVERDDKGHIKVNDVLETTASGIYALGDVKGGPAFTHISYNDYVVVTKNLLEGGNLSTKGRMVPYCMFTDPQLGRIGITETEAEEQELDYLVAKLPMKNIARAIENSETTGFMKAVVDRKTKQILGATIIGEQGGEIMSILQMAMLGEITYEQIRFMIFAHPLYAESLNNLFMALED